MESVGGVVVVKWVKSVRYEEICWHDIAHKLCIKPYRYVRDAGVEMHALVITIRLHMTRILP